MTDPGFAGRIRDLIRHNPNFTINDVRLLKTGRHFRLSAETKLIVGRNEEENKRLVKRADKAKVGNILGVSASMERLFDSIAKVAPTEVTVLITGETGTGKGLFARCIHDLSDRKTKEFVTIDCASIPSELLEHC